MNKITAGIFFIYNNKFLICHPTNASWKQWSIPKGLVDLNESIQQSAIRELYEETGINLKDYTYDWFELTSQKYTKQDKVLNSFAVLPSSFDLNFNFKCKEINNSFEIDAWKWVSFNDKYIEYLHKTQQLALQELLSIQK